MLGGKDNLDPDYYSLPRLGKVANELSNLEVSRLKNILLLIPPGIRTILDVGCGDGIIANPLAKKFNLTAMDYSPQALLHVNAKKVLARGEDIPFKGAFFDLVLLCDLLEHLDAGTMEMVIRESTRVAKRYILVNSPHQEDLEKASVYCPDCARYFHVNWHMQSLEPDALSARFPGYRPVVKKYCSPRGWGLFIKKEKPVTAQIPTMCPGCRRTLKISACAKKRRSISARLRDLSSYIGSRRYCEFIILFEKI